MSRIGVVRETICCTVGIAEFRVTAAVKSTLATSPAAIPRRIPPVRARAATGT
jgi:hypothetical protein